MILRTYVNFGGNCMEALKYYEQHLGGKIDSISTFDQIPCGAAPAPGLKPKNVMHARLTLGGTQLMVSDAPPDRYQPMRSAYLTLVFDNSAAAERVHKALADGGEVFMPMEETFFAHRFSMLRDRFGANWMLIHEKPMPPR